MYRNNNINNNSNKPVDQLIDSPIEQSIETVTGEQDPDIVKDTFSDDPIGYIIDKGSSLGSSIGSAANKLSEFIDTNPALRMAVNTLFTAGFKKLATPNAKFKDLMLNSASTILPNALTEQSIVQRQKSLYNPDIAAQNSGVFDSPGYNTGGVGGLVSVKLKKMYSSLPSHLKPKMQAYMENLGIIV